jgi:hypothetical protein
MQNGRGSGMDGTRLSIFTSFALSMAFSNSDESTNFTDSTNWFRGSFGTTLNCGDQFYSFFGNPSSLELSLQFSVFGAPGKDDMRRDKFHTLGNRLERGAFLNSIAEYKRRYEGCGMTHSFGALLDQKESSSTTTFPATEIGQDLCNIIGCLLTVCLPFSS